MVLLRLNLQPGRTAGILIHFIVKTLKGYVFHFRLIHTLFSFNEPGTLPVPKKQAYNLVEIIM